MNPNFNFERKLWSKGLRYVVGVDEVGRGCFAGPVFAACVGFTSDAQIPTNLVVRDSKLLTQKQRNDANLWIKDQGSQVAIGNASVSEINKIGISKASTLAMRRAIKNAEKKLQKNTNFINFQHVLIDAFYIPFTKGIPKRKQTPIIKGDSKVFSIAAASIVAKVARDDLMEKLGMQKEFLVYQWYQNKGYGTASHREAILSHGITKHHRKQFVETFLRKHSS